MMNQEQNVLNTTELTMTSIEIAALTGKNHADVLRDIRNILKEAEIEESKFAGEYKTNNNQTKPCYNLPRRECDLVVSGYSVKYRLAIIDRWQELEAATQVIANNLGMTKKELLADIKLDAQIEAVQAKRQATQLKLQALKDKLAKQSEVLNAKTTAILSRGAKVKGDLTVGKLDLPTDCITELLKLHGSGIEPKIANWALRQLGYLTKDNQVTEAGLVYGKTIKTSPKAKTTLARWYVAEFPELLQKIDEIYTSEFITE